MSYCELIEMHRQIITKLNEVLLIYTLDNNKQAMDYITYQKNKSQEEIEKMFRSLVKSMLSFNSNRLSDCFDFSGRVVTNTINDEKFHIDYNDDYNEVAKNLSKYINDIVILFFNVKDGVENYFKDKNIIKSIRRDKNKLIITTNISCLIFNIKITPDFLLEKFIKKMEKRIEESKTIDFKFQFSYNIEVQNCYFGFPKVKHTDNLAEKSVFLFRYFNCFKHFPLEHMELKDNFYVYLNKKNYIKFVKEYTVNNNAYTVLQWKHDNHKTMVTYKNGIKINQRKVNNKKWKELLKSIV